MQWQQRIGVGDGAQKVAHVGVEKLVFVFFHHGVQPMAIVMQEDSNDGYAPHGLTLIACQQFISHV